MQECNVKWAPWVHCASNSVSIYMPTANWLRLYKYIYACPWLVDSLRVVKTSSRGRTRGKLRGRTTLFFAFITSSLLASWSVLQCFLCDASVALFLVMERQENRNSVSVAFITTFPSQQKGTVLDAMITISISMPSFLSQWVAMMLVAGQNYIDSSGSAIQCMQDKGNGKNWE